MAEPERNYSPFETWWRKNVWGIVTVPAEWFHNAWLKVQRDNPENVFYHRRFRRVPTIDQCRVGDAACYYEANEQYKRDKLVEQKIVEILRRRKRDCHIYYIHDDKLHCGEIDREVDEAETNWFIKYGDLGRFSNVKDAYMKQKHRMIWERRHGPVGSGMITDEPNMDINRAGAYRKNPGGAIMEDSLLGGANVYGARVKDGSTHASATTQ